MPFKIKLPCGRTTLVDGDTFRKYGHLSWYADWKGTQWQVVCGIPAPVQCGRRQRKILLSNIVLPPVPGKTVDHANRDTFDNRRRNLRHATREEQRMNCGPARGRKYKGVFKDAGKWRAQINSIYLGRFASPEEAARVYNKEARRRFGRWAWLNPT